jgi:hypothetical protein
MKGGKFIHAPATFAERGAAVPFTTPLLSLTRVRPDERNGLEILVPSFADGKGIYVIPWRAVPEMVGMTVHDRFLHAAIQSAGGVAPRDVRKAGLKAARNGLAGPAAAKAAKAALAQDDEHKTVTHFLLLIELMRAAGLESMDTLRTAFGKADGDAAVKRYVRQTADHLHIEPPLLDSRLSEIAEAMSPIGLSFAPEPGRLRRRMAELSGFVQSVSDFARQDKSDTAPVAGFCGEVAGQTLTIGLDLLKDFDRRARGVGAAIRDWGSQRQEIRDVAERLEWLTDGWEFVAASWRTAQKADAVEQRMAISEIFRILPLVPEKECDLHHADAAGDMMGRHRRAVRMYEDWRTGALDVDLVRRIETAKASAA